jgi:HD-like signal output (HDOD) protein
LTNAAQQTTSDTAFAFVRSLAGELSTGRVDLPSFPEIAIRVRRVLSDPNSSVDQVVRVVGSEPALGARLLKMSNSASLNRSGKTVSDLRTAINRIGYNMVRSAAIAFAMAQIRASNKLAGLEHYLTDLWKSSTHVAAFAFVLARICTKINPDEAMLTGMMHGIGKLYVLTRAVDHPELFAETAMLNEIIDDWHAVIGKSILENWEFADFMSQAVGEQNDLERDDDGPADLRDIIAIAIVMASMADNMEGLEVALQGLPAVLRLGLNSTKSLAIVRDSAAEIKALSEALGN